MGRGIFKNKLNNYINDNKLNKFIKIINYQANPFSYLIQSIFLYYHLSLKDCQTFY